MALISMVSCQSDPLSPGVEYMPDMYRTPAYGTYVNYNNSDSSVSRKPVEGTIVYSYNSENINLNNLPYPFEKTTEGYEKAGQVLKNPLAKTDLVIAEGKELYGETFENRQKILFDLFDACNKPKAYSHYVIEDRFWLSKNIDQQIYQKFKEITNKDVDEGFVLKKKDSKLQDCTSQKNNQGWQMKFRHPSKKYQF
jgi:hypothetical protein